MTDHAAELAERWRSQAPDHSMASFPPEQSNGQKTERSLSEPPVGHSSGIRLTEEAWDTMRASCAPSTGSKIGEMALYGLDYAVLGLAAGARISPRVAAVGLALGLVNGIAIGHIKSKANELDCLNSHSSGK